MKKIRPGGLSPARVLAAHLREDLRAWALDTPGTSELYAYLHPWLRGHRVGIADVVIEGCARSGNTYARLAFEYANRDCCIASHFHQARPVEYAVRRSVPTIVVVRNPLDALASTLQFSRRGDIEHILGTYERFHRRVLTIADRVVVADFDQVTGDFGSVIERCNERFGSHFVPYRRTDESEAIIAERIRRIADHVDRDRADQIVNLPSPARLSAEKVVGQLNASQRSLLQECDELYLRFRALAGQQGRRSPGRLSPL